ncbi:MAG: hypothetical protein V2A73_16260 [Pseudomonadota bacterium]
MNDYLYHPTSDELRLIRTVPGLTSDGRPFSWHVDQQVAQGKLRLECVRADVLGLSRPLEVFRAKRSTNLVKPWTRTDDGDAYCPAHWADLAIGSGACGLRCRACFLIMTHRVKADPSRHVLYDNVLDYQAAVKRWLAKPDRRCLGLGIDCSDSLLYEGVTGHARRLIPLFADARSNPCGVKLIFLTKSTNTHYLCDLPTGNVAVTFSLNNERAADLWEGKFSDGTRVTPAIAERLAAALAAQKMGFEVRWRVDPVFAIDGFEQDYESFFREAAAAGHAPSRITLGTYRETQPALRTFVRNWGLPAVEVVESGLVKERDHYHLKAERRVEIYAALNRAITSAWRGSGHQPVVSLCKEPRSVREQVGLLHDRCNCAP